MAKLKDITPGQWLAAAISIFVFGAGALMTVRAEDLHSIGVVQIDHEKRLQEVEKNMAVLVQKESDLIDLFNRYLQENAKGARP